MPPSSQDSGNSTSEIAECTRQLHWDGWTRLPDQWIPKLRNWEPGLFVERLYRRYHKRIIAILEKHRDDWLEPDDDEEGRKGPGADRPGGLVARLATEGMHGTGVFVYAAHPSQSDDSEEKYDYSGPRWYVTVTEALLKHYRYTKVAPPPPEELQSLLWPNADDQNRPWLTELGWTIVPEDSHPQVMHADICAPDAPNPRKPGQGRYHHFAWKLEEEQLCTTNVVPGAFTEGKTDWEHYAPERWKIASGRAIAFDSEMLHRGNPTKPGVGWSSTLTLQVCSGTGYDALVERVSEEMMYYTQRLGWASGDAIEACVNGTWHRAFISKRFKSGQYDVTVEDSGNTVEGLTDSQIRYRSKCDGADFRREFPVGALVDVLTEGKWCAAKVARCNLDGTYRVIWRKEHTFTDGVEGSALRLWRFPSPEKSPEKRRPSKRDSGGTRVDAQVLDDASPPIKKRRKERNDVSISDMRCTLFDRGYVELSGGLPLSWRWEVFDFVEKYYDMFNDCVIRELDSLRDFWEPCEDSNQRHGAFAAEKATQRLKAHGIAIYSPGPSQETKDPYRMSGPRWYVSVTAAALKHFGVAPAPPEDLFELICNHPQDSEGTLRARGLGWALAPPGSDPQALHADIWGHSAHARVDRCRWPHILWKRNRSQLCTTQIVPGGFTSGAVYSHHYDSIEQVRAPAIVVDSECLHRGAPVAQMPADTKVPAGWASSLSLELCTPSGWAAWEDFGTGGTEKDPNSTLDWRMLKFAQQDKSSVKYVNQMGDGTTIPVVLPEAPWMNARGKQKLRAEQRQWELYS